MKKASAPEPSLDYDSPKELKAYNKARRRLFMALCERSWDNEKLDTTQKIAAIAFGINRTHDEAVAEVVGGRKANKAKH